MLRFSDHPPDTRQILFSDSKLGPEGLDRSGMRTVQDIHTVTSAHICTKTKTFRPSHYQRPYCWSIYYTPPSSVKASAVTWLALFALKITKPSLLPGPCLMTHVLIVIDVTSFIPYHSLLHTVLSVHVTVNMNNPCCCCCHHNLHMAQSCIIFSHHCNYSCNFCFLGTISFDIICNLWGFLWYN